MTSVPPRHDPIDAPDLTGLPGVDPAWSRRVVTIDSDGTSHVWHVLDTGAAVDSAAESSVVGTLLCVHGNPTWSYLWRRLLATAPPGWRVVAVDQLGMGWSERGGDPRNLAARVDDLGALTAKLGLTGQVVVVAHDWGGPVSLGWALAHRAQVAAVVLTNTAVHHPEGSSAPALIRIARLAGLRHLVCVTTPSFVRAATALSRPRLAGEVRDAFASPYRHAARRQAVGDFVADIPLEDDHPSRGTLDAIADGLEMLAGVPFLLLWGTRDPVFTELYLRDLLARVPHADVHRYPSASHLVMEDAPQATHHLWSWLTDLAAGARHADAPVNESPVVGEPSGAGPIWAALTARAGDPTPAVVELGANGRTVSFAALAGQVLDLAGGLVAAGVHRGDRVALLVPPGVDLTTIVYACWRIGAAVVIADAGLGVAPMGRALRGAAPDHVIGVARGLALARAMRVPGRRFASGPISRATAQALDVTATVAHLADLGRGQPLPPEPMAEDECAVLFTSGATGPAKGVVYRHRQVRAQLDMLASTLGVTPADRFVAAFAPFALYGPALGITAAAPDMDVTAPGTLTAAGLADAAAAVDATIVFASPAALTNVVATAADLSDRQRAALAGVRLVTSAGAPVPVRLLRQVQRMVPNAELHTPYGMTEVLPVADISLPELEAAGDGNGVCVGRPLVGVEVRVSALTDLGVAAGAVTTEPEVTGELLVRAAHVKDRYDRLWATERASSRDVGWHRTGDVGHLDREGRLWVEGRLVHVITTPSGPVTPVAVEQRVQRVDGVRAAAAVGVGPAGTQQVVVVLAVGDDRRRRVSRVWATRRDVLAPSALAHAVRETAGVEVAAVLTVEALPVDIRHASKVDRARVARWADTVLSGRRVPRL